MASNKQIMSAIMPILSPKWQERIPADSQTAWEKVGVMISSGNYDDLRNEVYDALVNLIAKTKVWQKSLSNPLGIFKSGRISGGDTYQEIMSDIIEAQTFKIAEDDQFKKWPSKVWAAYHRINREEYYPITIEETKIDRAFRSEGGLNSLVNSIVNQMYSSNDLDEFLYTKKCLAGYYTQTEVPVLATQKVTTVNPIDEDTGKQFLLAAMDSLDAMRFPSRDYNPIGAMLQTNPSEYVIIMKATANRRIRVETLTGAFNKEYLDLNIPIITIDNFEEGMENVIAVIADRGLLRIFDTLRTLRMAENGRNLYRNYYYHVHQLYAASPFVNAIFLETA